MPPARLKVHRDGAGLLKCKQVLGYARLTGTHCFHDVASGRRTMRGKVAEDLIPGPVAKRRNGCLDVGGPGDVVRLRNPWHATILTERPQIRKTRSLDATLIIFDNSLYSLLVVVVGPCCGCHS